jgi:hypothetical protein
MNVFNRKGRKAFIYRRNFAFFAVYVFLILLHIINFASLKTNQRRQKKHLSETKRQIGKRFNCEVTNSLSLNVIGA